jgi:hypothetical protein
VHRNDEHLLTIVVGSHYDCRFETLGGPIMRIGVYVFGIAAVAYGITDLVWGEFDRSDQPLQAWGDHVPGATIFAYIAALWLVVAGAALLWPGSRRFAAASGRPLRHVCAVSLLRFCTAPLFHGYRAWSGNHPFRRGSGRLEIAVRARFVGVPMGRVSPFSFASFKATFLESAYWS